MFYERLSRGQGYRPWRRLGNGVVVWRAEFSGGRRSWRAIRDGEIVASLTEAAPGGVPAGGHVDGDYSLVQGRDAPLRQYRDWEAAVREL